MAVNRVIVCGGRDFNDGELMAEVLQELPPNTVVVHGDCPTGADRLAENMWGNTEPHPANWKKHGRAAGPIRNQKMADLGADRMIAFPGGNGTLDMTQRAARAGIPVRLISPREIA
jgi:hypothetical protein